MLNYYKYHLPFKKPFRIAGNEFTHREGIILVYRDAKSGIEAYGEVAPLPGFSSETLPQVEEVLKINRKFLQESLTSGSGSEALQVIDQIHQFPSLSFGLDTLLYDLAAKREQKPLVNYLFPGINNSVQSNGVLSLQSLQETLDTARDLIRQGFKTLKVKVGENFKSEYKILEKLRAAFPGINIRIDANQGWTADEAISNLYTLEGLNIEYCEQPVSLKNKAQLKKVKDAVKISVAADESVWDKNEALELIEHNSADILILKPSLLGTFKNIYVTIKAADTHSIAVVFTTALESGIGRAAISALAAGYGNKNLAHGLSTGVLFEQNITPEHWLNKPEILFPDTPGLGISVHLRDIEEF